MKRVLGSTLISYEQIQRRIADLGREISQDYAGKSITFVAILKGSFIFVADLIRQVSPEIPVEIDFMSVSSYGNQTSSSGTIVIEATVSLTGPVNWQPVQTNNVAAGAFSFSIQQGANKTGYFRVRAE